MVASSLKSVLVDFEMRFLSATNSYNNKKCFKSCENNSFNSLGIIKKTVYDFSTKKLNQRIISFINFATDYQSSLFIRNMTITPKHISSKLFKIVFLNAEVGYLIQ